jgi:uroporphyrinogen decarboxylase
MGAARRLVAAPMALQGNLDPAILLAGGEALADGVTAIQAAMRGRAHIFNLGHGVLPETPVEHVERLVEIVRGGEAG